METPRDPLRERAPPSQHLPIPTSTSNSTALKHNSGDVATSIRQECDTQRRKSATVALRWKDQLEELVRNLQTALADKSKRVRTLQQERNNLVAQVRNLENDLEQHASSNTHTESELRDIIERQEHELSTVRDRLRRAEGAAEMAGQIAEELQEQRAIRKTLQYTVTELTVQRDTLQHELFDASAASERDREKIEQLGAKIEAIASVRDELLEEVANANEQLRRARDEVKRNNSQRDEDRGVDIDWVGTLERERSLTQETQQQLQLFRRENKKLKNELNMYRDVRLLSLEEASERASVEQELERLRIEVREERQAKNELQLRLTEGARERERDTLLVGQVGERLRMESQVEQLKLVVSKDKNEKAAMQQELERLKGEVRDECRAKIELEGLRRDCARIQEERDSLKSDAVNGKQTNTELQRQIALAETRLDTMREEKLAAESRYETLREQASTKLSDAQHKENEDDHVVTAERKADDMHDTRIGDLTGSIAVDNCQDEFGGIDDHSYMQSSGPERILEQRLREQQQERTTALLELIYARLDRIDSDNQRHLMHLESRVTPPAARMEADLANIGKQVSKIKQRIFAQQFLESDASGIVISDPNRSISDQESEKKHRSKSSTLVVGVVVNDKDEDVDEKKKNGGANKILQNREKFESEVEREVNRRVRKLCDQLKMVLKKRYKEEKKHSRNNNNNDEESDDVSADIFHENTISDILTDGDKIDVVSKTKHKKGRVLDPYCRELLGRLEQAEKLVVLEVHARATLERELVLLQKLIGGR